jgi:hypothetical protein
MTGLIWLIVGGVFGAPLLILLALVVMGRLGKASTGKTINLLWMVLGLMLALFLGLGVFSTARQ